MTHGSKKIQKKKPATYIPYVKKKRKSEHQHTAHPHAERMKKRKETRKKNYLLRKIGCSKTEQRRSVITLRSTHKKHWPTLKKGRACKIFIRAGRPPAVWKNREVVLLNGGYTFDNASDAVLTASHTRQQGIQTYVRSSSLAYRLHPTAPTKQKSRPAFYCKTNQSSNKHVGLHSAAKPTIFR